MTDSDMKLREALREAQQNAERGHAPPFGSVWAAATVRARTTRRRRRAVVGSVAVAAAAVFAVALLMPRGVEPRFIDAEELLGTTSWFAPSDGLLPEHRFDIYEDIPVLIESTETYGGALL